MNINFIPTIVGKDGNYDLVADGKEIVSDLSPEEVLNMIDNLSKERESISQMDLFYRSLKKVNLKAADPSIPLGISQLLFIEGEIPKGLWGQEMRVYERNTDKDSYLIFALYWIGGIDISGNVQEKCAWSFYINRVTKEVGKMIGYCEEVPTGETRKRILERLILLLGRDIKIMI